METNIYYRVRPEHFGYSHEDFETLEEAVGRANKRNSLRYKDHPKGELYKGDNCKVQKVTITIEEITT